MALTFLTNELFRFNDPFCRKNRKIAEIIAEGGVKGKGERVAVVGGHLKGQRTLHALFSHLLSLYL